MVIISIKRIKDFIMFTNVFNAIKTTFFGVFSAIVVGFIFVVTGIVILVSDAYRFVIGKKDIETEAIKAEAYTEDTRLEIFNVDEAFTVEHKLKFLAMYDIMRDSGELPEVFSELTEQQQLDMFGELMKERVSENATFNVFARFLTPKKFAFYNELFKHRYEFYKNYGKNIVLTEEGKS